MSSCCHTVVHLALGKSMRGPCDDRGSSPGQPTECQVTSICAYQSKLMVSSTAEPANDERPARVREPACVFCVAVNVVDLEQSLEGGHDDPCTECSGVIKFDLWQFVSMYFYMLETSWDLAAGITRLVKQHSPIRRLKSEGCYVSPYHQPITGGVSACEFTNFLALLPAIRSFQITNQGWFGRCTLCISPTPGPSFFVMFLPGENRSITSPCGHSPGKSDPDGPNLVCMQMSP